MLLVTPKNPILIQNNTFSLLQSLNNAGAIYFYLSSSFSGTIQILGNNLIQNVATNKGGAFVIES